VGDPKKKKTPVVITRPVVPATGTIFEWMDRRGIIESAAGGGISASIYAERPFFLPTLDSDQLVAEGPPPRDWEGYHAGKHGVYERFGNLKGESVNMGELFFGEKFRWIRPEYLTDVNHLKYITEFEAYQALELAYGEGIARPLSMRGIFDSAKFTQDISDLFQKYAPNAKSTVWQGRYVYRNGNLGDLQINTDFEAFGHNWRLAVDAQTGKMLNFFKIDLSKPPMKFTEIVVKWWGKITDVTIHKSPDGTLAIEIAAKWPGLLKQGITGGAMSGGIAGIFLGAISGFRQGGIPGALKGMAIGGLVGAATGAVFGGVAALLTRLLPWVGKVVKVAGFVLTVAAILLDASPTALDGPEWDHDLARIDDDGNSWSFRNVHNAGTTAFPDYTPRGVRVITREKAVFEFGEESPSDSSYERTPITVFANFRQIKWHMSRTPEGSSLWWWMDAQTGAEFLVTYQDDDAMKFAIDQFAKEQGYRAKNTTQN